MVEWHFCELLNDLITIVGAIQSIEYIIKLLKKLKKKTSHYHRIRHNSRKRKTQR
nr:MAG TPA: hypothetical protein [Caudoviricetes sp.]